MAVEKVLLYVFVEVVKRRVGEIEGMEKRSINVFEFLDEIQKLDLFAKDKIIQVNIHFIVPPSDF